jgi:hypothetical protein
MTATCQCSRCCSDREAADAMTRYRARKTADAEMVGSAGRLQQIIDQHYRDNPQFNEVNSAACR